MNEFTCFLVQIRNNFSGYIPINEINRTWSMHISIFFLLCVAKFFCNLYSAVYQTSCLTNTVMNEFKDFATQMGMNVYLLLTSVTFFFLKSP